MSEDIAGRLYPSGKPTAVGEPLKMFVRKN